jgi:hypothetical protein
VNKKERRDKLTQMITKIVAKSSAKNGRILQDGWVLARMSIYKHIEDEKTLMLMRESFMGGAHHLYTMMMHALDPGEDPTTADLCMYEGVSKELENWYDYMAEKYIGKDDARPV